MDQLYDLQQAWFRQIHRHPELGEEEFETTRLVKSVLEEYGIRQRPCPLPTGAIAEIGSGSGPVIGLRADMDALPIDEQTDLPYKSEIPGKMHACGHDFHTAAMLGAAVLLKEIEDKLPGKAVLVFQPSEEVSGGGKQIASTGLTDDAEVFLALHSYPHFEKGTLGIKEGPVMAAVDQFMVTVTGKGAHGAAPHKGLDPIPVMAEITLALQTIISRRIDPFDTALLSVTRLDAGTTWNVIPETGVMEGTVRSFDENVRNSVIDRFNQICRGICAAHGCKCEIQWFEGPPPVVNDAGLCQVARDVATRLGFRVEKQENTMGGEDFAEFLHIPRQRPGLFVRVGTGGEYANHHPKFTVDPEALYPASVFLREMALELMRR